MTPTEFFSCFVSFASLGVAFAALSWAKDARRIASEADRTADRVIDLVYGYDDGDEDVPGLSERMDDAEDVLAEAQRKAESLAKTCDEIKARLVLEPTAKKQIETLRRELNDLGLVRISPADGSGFYSPLACQVEKNREAIEGLRVVSDRIREGIRHAAAHAAGSDPDAETETNIEVPASIFPDATGDAIRRSFVPSAYGAD